MRMDGPLKGMQSARTLMCLANTHTAPQHNAVVTHAPNVAPGRLPCFAAWIKAMVANDRQHRDGDENSVVEEPVYPSGKRRQDEALFAKDRHRWCADRCLATGYCDVLEDIYDMTTAQVQEFCEKCAAEDECELAYS